jgi:hypothetical protein
MTPERRWPTIRIVVLTLSLALNLMLILKVLRLYRVIDFQWQVVSAQTQAVGIVRGSDPEMSRSLDRLAETNKKLVVLCEGAWSQ